MPIDIISYRDLEVWRQAMDLADLVYDITELGSVGRLAHGLEGSLEVRLEEHKPQRRQGCH